MTTHVRRVHYTVSLPNGVARILSRGGGVRVHEIRNRNLYLTSNRRIKTAAQRTVIQQYGDWYSAVDGWAVTFGTARRGLGELRPRPVPYSLYQM